MDLTYRVADRDWDAAMSAFRETSPYNYAVLDGFLEPEDCRRLHRELLSDPGWTRQGRGDQALLSIKRPDVPATREIARQIKERCGPLLGGYEFVDSWVLLYPEGAPRVTHSDVGAMTLNLWLTPDECNLEPERGGLVFFDVKRRGPERPGEDAAYLWSERFLEEHTGGRSARVSYRWNRALLFDARTFHRTDHFRFTNSSMGAYRMNYSLTFDDPDAFEEVSRALRGGYAAKPASL
jgi:hypothetical protein